jgi:hypothetical protein
MTTCHMTQAEAARRIPVKLRALAALVLVLAVLGAATSSTAQATSDALVKAGIPDWASDCVADLLHARQYPTADTGATTRGDDFNVLDDPLKVPNALDTYAAAKFGVGNLYQIDDEELEVTAITDSRDVIFRRGSGGTKFARHAEGAEIRRFSELAALDAETDELAAAMLALEYPEGVIALYDRWYPANGPGGILETRFRTPAAPLLKAQAFRLRAWQRFYPPEGRGPGGAPGGDAFQRANEDYGMAIPILTAAIGNLGGGGTGVPDNLGVWIESGLPKPRSLDTLRAGTDKPKALAASEALEFARAYHEWLARTHRELGELVFRATGSAAAPPAGGTHQDTALAYFAAARGPLYFARLVDPLGGGLDEEAARLKILLNRARDGQNFDGKDFYRVQPYRDETSLRASLDGLAAKIQDLRRLESQGAGVASSQLTWLVNLQKEKASRDLLDNAFRSQARRELTHAILDIRAQVNKLVSNEAFFEIRAANDALQNHIMKGQLALTELRYTTELNRYGEQYLQDFQAMLQDLERHGVKPILSPQSDADDIDRDFQTLDRFVGALDAPPGVDSTALAIKSLWHEVLQKRKAEAVEPGTTVAIKREEYDAANREVAIRQDALTTFDLKAEVARLNQDVAVLESQRGDTEARIKELWPQFEEEKRTTGEAEKARQLKDLVIPRLRGEVDHFTQRLREAIGKVKEFQAKLAEFRKTVEELKGAHKRVEDAYEQLVGIVKSAKAIPVTITGMSPGTLIDVGGKIASSAEAVLRSLVAAYEGKNTASDLDVQLKKAEAEVDKRLKEAEDVERSLADKKAKLEAAGKLDDALKPFLEGGTAYQRYVEREDALKTAKNKLDEGITKLTNQIRGREATIQGFDRRQLEGRWEQAVHVAKAALGRLELAHLELAHRVELLVTQVRKIESLDVEKRNAKALIDFYDAGLGIAERKLREKVKRREDLRPDQLMLEQDLRSALVAFRSELDELSRPRDRLVAPELIRSLAPALALSGLRPRPEKVQKLIDEANREVLAAARWLYLLGDDTSCVALASSCRTTAELESVAGRLKAKADDLFGRFEGASPFLVNLRVDRESLQKLAGAGNDDSFLLRVAVGTPAVNQRERDELFTNTNMHVYVRPEIKAGAATFHVTDPAEKRCVLLGFWILPAYEDSAPAPAPFPTLRPLGLVRHRVEGGRSRALPLKPAGSQVDLRILVNQYNEPNIKTVLATLTGPNGSANLIRTPFPGALRVPNFTIFGRGIENVWSFRLEDAGARPVRALADLKDLRIVLLVVAPLDEERPATDGAGPPPPDLSFLAAGSINASTEDRKFYGTDLANSPAARNARFDAIERALNSRTEPLPDAAAPTDAGPEEIRRVVSEELEQVFGGGTGSGASVLRPMDVTGEIRKAAVLLRRLADEVRKEYVKPLMASRDTLARVGARFRQVEGFAETLYRQNVRFSALVEYVKALEDIAGIVDGTHFPRSELSRLEDAIRSVMDWPGRVAARAGAKLATDPGNTRAAMIRRVLEQIVAEKLEYRRGQTTGGTPAGSAAPGGK